MGVTLKSAVPVMKLIFLVFDVYSELKYEQDLTICNCVPIWYLSENRNAKEICLQDKPDFSLVKCFLQIAFLFVKISYF